MLQMSVYGSDGGQWDTAVTGGSVGYGSDGGQWYTLQSHYLSHTTPNKEIQNTHYRDKLMLKSLPPHSTTEPAVKIVT